MTIEPGDYFISHDMASGTSIGCTQIWKKRNDGSLELVTTRYGNERPRTMKWNWSVLFAYLITFGLVYIITRSHGAPVLYAVLTGLLAETGVVAIVRWSKGLL